MRPAFVYKFKEEKNMKEKIKRFLKNNKGASEVTQSFLLIGVAIALVLTVFFPAVSKAFKNTSNSLESWMTDAAESIFSIKAEPNAE